MQSLDISMTQGERTTDLSIHMGTGSRATTMVINNLPNEEAIKLLARLIEGDPEA